MMNMRCVVVPKFIHCILHDEQPPIFGTGKQSRDFTYIKTDGKVVAVSHSVFKKI